MSEKDQEQFMKHTPVEGAPQFDVAAPADECSILDLWCGVSRLCGRTL